MTKNFLLPIVNFIQQKVISRLHPEEKFILINSVQRVLGSKFISSNRSRRALCGTSLYTEILRL